MEEAVEDAEPDVERGDGELEDALDGVHQVALHRVDRVLDGGVDVLNTQATTANRYKNKVMLHAACHGLWMPSL